jgi:type I restriction enzyme S subunit
MKTTWRKVKLGQIAEEVRELYEPSTAKSLAYIGLEHIAQQSLQINGIGDSAQTQSTKKKFKNGDILFGSLRPYFRKVYRPSFDGVCSTDITVIQAKEGYDQAFLFYFIANKPFIDYATGHSNGTRMPRANWKVLEKSEWTIPDLPTQRRIAAILSAYDDLIENNNHRIKILEEMAQTIYREWFVNFLFPGHEKVKMVNSKMGLPAGASAKAGKIPEGWEVVRVEEIIHRIPPGELYDKKTAMENGMVPILDQGRSGVIGYHNNELGVVASEDNPVIVFANHTCYQRLIMFPFSAIQNVLPFIPSDKKMRNIIWLYYATKDLVKFNDYKGHWPELMNKKLIFPPAKLCSMFGQYVGIIIQELWKYEQINTKLRKIRDLLLPKLVGGEVVV